jgi:hypothetical protein
MTTRWHRLVALLMWIGILSAAHGAAPEVLHMPGYDSPVRGDPDDLLMIPGVGFRVSDRVVYQAMDLKSSRPAAIPPKSTAAVGIAPVVQHGTPAYALTIRLPEEMQKGRAYRLWVVTQSGEWSQPVAINDPRPQWVTPSYVYATAELAGLGRMIRLVGRNLADNSGRPLQIRLQGPKESSYTLTSQAPANPSEALQSYVAAAVLPKQLSPGLYTVSVRRDGLGWIDLIDQKLEVRPDPAPLPTFSPDDPAYGGCHPDDARDDTPCFARALEAAARAGGGVIEVPPGHWNITPPRDGNGFVLARNVHVRGDGPRTSFILRQGELDVHGSNPLFTVTGHNSVTGLSISDELRFTSLHESRSVIQLGPIPTSDESKTGGSHLVEDIVIDNNVFLHVGRAITDDSGRPVARILITRNEFGGYSEGIALSGNLAVVWELFRIDDSVVRGNRFIPGSYVDIAIHQGVIGTELGAGHHVDFSDNVADGTDNSNLQDPDDPPGFRAGFFWDLNGSVETTLISGNQISCPGDKAGDGEAIAFDGNGDTYGFDQSPTPTIVASGPDWITVHGQLYSEHSHRPVAAHYYDGHWVQIVGGRGIGQARKITSYTQDATHSTVTLHVAPAWDITPGGADSRVYVQRLYWQVAVVGNNIEQRRPPCRKSNLNGRYGGPIVIWASSANVAIEGNQQWDADGILFMQAYDAASQPGCRGDCTDRLYFQTGLEIRGNRIDGEYDWSSDCSLGGGIRGLYGAGTPPRSSPPVEGIGTSISHNSITRSDGLRGGGINIALHSYAGPPPGDWPFIENLLIFHNELRDIDGPLPVPTCHRGQSERSGIRLEGHDNVRNTVLYGNRCERVTKPLSDSGLRTLRICPAGAHDSCECAGAN